MAYVVGLTKTQPRHRLGDVPDIRYLPEAASQSFVAGDLVKLVSGKVTVCTDDPANLYGVAMSNATGVTNAMVPVLVLDACTELILPVYDSTSGSLVRAATDHAQVGRDCGVAKVAHGKWCIDLKTTLPNKAAKIKGMWYGDTATNSDDPHDTRRVQVGDQGRVIVGFLDAKLQTRNAS